MATFIETLRSHVVGISTTVTSIVAILGAVFLIDGRYAHADAVQKVYTEQAQVIEQLRQDGKVQFEQIQLISLEDRIFYLEQKADKNAQDQAQLNRFYRQREDAVRRIDRLLGSPN